MSDHHDDLVPEASAPSFQPLISEDGNQENFEPAPAQNAGAAPLDPVRDPELNQDPWPMAFDNVSEDRPPLALRTKPQESSVQAAQTQDAPSIYVEQPEGFKEPQPITLDPMYDIDVENTRFTELCDVNSPALRLRDGDTLVFVDYPELRRSSPKKVNCFNMEYRSQQFRVHSHRLLATGSSKFTEMLNPTYQYRVQRRRKLVNQLPEGIKFVIDLTPPLEGDELVFQMTELSLSPGIRNWWTAAQLLDVSSFLVTGHDDICDCNRRSPLADVLDEHQRSLDRIWLPPPVKHNTSQSAKTPPKPSPQLLLQMRDAHIKEAIVIPDYREIPDYCPVRHCNNIIRLLMIIEGKDITLESANRVWTLVALAKIFDCVAVVRDKVAQWIMYGNNTKFIEVLPEEAFQIGFTLQIVTVTQSAFRILVNELAIEESASVKLSPGARRATTVFGRKRGNLDDELSNVVQHSARALIERASNVCQDLHSPGLLDRWGLPEWQKLQRLAALLAQEPRKKYGAAFQSIKMLIQGIEAKVSAILDETLGDDRFSKGRTEYMDKDRAAYVMPGDFETIGMISQRLNTVQKFLCSLPYQVLDDYLSTSYSDDVYQDVWVSAMVREGASEPISTSRLRSVAMVTILQEFNERFQETGLVHSARARTGAWYQMLKGYIESGESLLDLTVLFDQLKEKLRSITSCWIRHDIDPPLNMTRHLLLTLTANEMKFLPLWAGGLNDGTGGVFEVALPPAEMGPSGPGPAYHTGITVASTASSVSGSLRDDIAAMKIRGSTVAGSVDAQDSISTVYAPGHVIADNVSIASESFESDVSEYRQARFELPADHQAAGQAVNMLMDEMSDSESVSTISHYEDGDALEGGPGTPVLSTTNNTDQDDLFDSDDDIVMI